MTELAETDIDEIQPEPEPEPEAQPAPETEADTDDAGFVVTIGDDAPPPEEDDDTAGTEAFRSLRKAHREATRRIRELEAATAQTKAPAKVELGPKPTQESCDYDEAKYDAELLAWHERKAAVARQHEAEKAERDAQEQAWRDRMDGYKSKRAELKAPDFDDAEDAVREVLDVTQQGIIVQGANNPALVVYALGKNPAKAKELASIKDPVKFSFAVARLELDLKMTPRKPSTTPEKPVTGAGRPSGSVDSTLERLREEAAKTGDISKVTAYKRSLAAKG